MNEFSNGFSAMSVEELEQVEGGLAILVPVAAGAAALAVGFCVGYTVTSLILKAID
jgi:lactobin A/cerein 7B family class IIb bacteriocin